MNKRWIENDSIDERMQGWVYLHKKLLRDFGGRVTP